jgi:hypothetical protein
LAIDGGLENAHRLASEAAANAYPAHKHAGRAFAFSALTFIPRPRTTFMEIGDLYKIIEKVRISS